MKQILDATATTKLAGTARTILELKGGHVHTIDRTDTVYHAVAKMSEMQVGALFVLEGTALIGVISERDYARKVILQGRASKETRVEEIMTSPVISVEPATPLSECMEIVTHRRVRHLPVLDHGQPVGVISIGDLIYAIVDQQAQIIEQLNTVISGPYPA
jgi:CBS domain-containing protein